jgi:hypothetical protein
MDMYFGKLLGFLMKALLMILSRSSTNVAVSRPVNIGLHLVLRRHMTADLLVMFPHRSADTSLVTEDGREETSSASSGTSLAMCDTSRSRGGHVASGFESEVNLDSSERDGIEESQYVDDREMSSLEDEDICLGTTHQLICCGDMRPQPPARLCIAEEVDVGPLLTSILYHRHVVGMQGPAIGISHTKSSPIVRVYMAWLADCIEKENDLVRTSVLLLNV